MTATLQEICVLGFCFCFIFKPFVQNASSCSISWSPGHGIPQHGFPRSVETAIIQTKYKIIRTSDQKRLMGQAGWVVKMTNFKALTGGKEPWRAPPTHPKTPAKVTCPSLCFLPQVTNIILHCKADKQVGSRKEGFLLQSGFCFLFLPSHRTGKEMFQQTASWGTALSLLPSQAQSPEHHLVLSHVWRKCVVSMCVPFHIGCR